VTKTKNKAISKIKTDIDLGIESAKAVGKTAEAVSKSKEKEIAEINANKELDNKIYYDQKIPSEAKYRYRIWSRKRDSDNKRLTLYAKLIAFLALLGTVIYAFFKKK